MVRTAASRSAAVKSFIFSSAICRTCARDTLPTLLLPGVVEPFSKPAAFLSSTDAVTGRWLREFGKRDELVAKTGKNRPVFLKIAPDLDEEQVKVIAATLQRHGMDGVIATNTTLSRDAVQGLQHAAEAGGLSGAPVLEASNRVIRQLRAALGKDYPIIGVGGILSAQDAVSKIEAGADLVQIYTGLIYRGPELVKEAAQAIKNRRA